MKSGYNADFLSADDIKAVRDVGLEIAVATINDDARARSYLDAGVEGVMTDYPDLLS